MGDYSSQAEVEAPLEDNGSYPLPDSEVDDSRSSVKGEDYR